MARISWTLKDYDNETSVITTEVKNFASGTYATWQIQMGDLRNAIIGVGSLGLASGVLIQEAQTAQVVEFDKTLPTDENFLRGRKWLVRYQDDVTFKVYRLEIPAGRTSGIIQTNRDTADFTSTAWDEFAQAFEALAKSPENNPVSILSARLVGRKLSIGRLP